MPEPPERPRAGFSSLERPGPYAGDSDGFVPGFRVGAGTAQEPLTEALPREAVLWAEVCQGCGAPAYQPCVAECPRISQRHHSMVSQGGSGKPPRIDVRATREGDV